VTGPLAGGGPRRRGLGRGLEALLGPVGEQQLGTGPGAETESGSLLLELDPAVVDPNPEQPRREFEEQALAALAESIRLHGLLHPIVVERAGGGRYRLVAGERRLRAAQGSGLAAIPAIVRPAAESARQSLETALTENLLRADLSPIEEAAAYARLADTFGLSHDAIAMRLGRSRPAVSNTIRLLTLPAPVQRAIADGHITAGHGKALLGLPDVSSQEAMAERAAAEAWSVRRAETEVQAMLGRLERPAGRRARSAALSPDDDALRRGMQERLGLPVELQRGRRGGRVIVSFHDDGDLGGLYERIGGAPL
jgi:ParB family chromosome partitioning protein